MIRLEDARILLRNHRFEGCYYLSGYAVECGLKACIAKLTKRHDFPDKNLREAYSHDVDLLLKMAKLNAPKDRELERDREFRLNWLIVQQWDHGSRYETPSEQRASELFKAVSDRKHGVLRWLRQYW